MRVSESTREFKAGYVHIANCGLRIRVCVYAHATMTVCGRRRDSMPTLPRMRRRIGVKQRRLSENKGAWLNILQTSSNKTAQSASQVSESTRQFQTGYVQMANGGLRIRICVYAREP